MAPRKRRTNYDWPIIEKEYREVFEQTGMSLGSYCKANGINHNTARKHIRTADLEIDLNDDLKGEILKEEQEVRSEEQVFLSAPVMPKKSGGFTPFVRHHRFSEKHGGYSKLIREEDFKDAIEIPLNDLDAEIVFVRAKIFQMARDKTELNERITDNTANGKDELAVVQIKLLSSMEIIEQDLIARVESLQRTAANNASMEMLDPHKAIKLQSSTNKDIAQTRVAEAMANEKERKNDTDESGGNVTYVIDW